MFLSFLCHFSLNNYGNKKTDLSKDYLDQIFYWKIGSHLSIGLSLLIEQLIPEKNKKERNIY